MRNYCLQGGAIPPEYLEMVLRREGQLERLKADELEAEKALEILSCLTAEASAQKTLNERPPQG